MGLRCDFGLLDVEVVLQVIVHVITDLGDSHIEFLAILTVALLAVFFLFAGGECVCVCGWMLPLS